MGKMKELLDQRLEENKYEMYELLQDLLEALQSSPYTLMVNQARLCRMIKISLNRIWKL